MAMFILLIYFQRFTSFFKDNVLNIFSVYIFYFNRHFSPIEASRSEIQEWLVLAKDF